MAQMTVRIDDNLKVQAEMLFAEIFNRRHDFS